MRSLLLQQKLRLLALQRLKLLPSLSPSKLRREVRKPRGPTSLAKLRPEATMNKTWKPRSLVMSLTNRLQLLLKKLSRKPSKSPRKLLKNKWLSRLRFKPLHPKKSRLLKPLLRIPQM